jgi:hypothetical protein
LLLQAAVLSVEQLTGFEDRQRGLGVIPDLLDEVTQ